MRSIMLRCNISVTESVVYGAMGIVYKLKSAVPCRDQKEAGELLKAKDIKGLVIIAPLSTPYQEAKGMLNRECR